MPDIVSRGKRLAKFPLNCCAASCRSLFMNRGLNIGIEIAASTAAREADWRFTRPGALVSPRKVGVTEGDSRQADVMRERHDAKGFNRDRPAVAADQARRGEGVGAHAAFTDSSKPSTQTGTPWLSAIY